MGKKTDSKPKRTRDRSQHPPQAEEPDGVQHSQQSDGLQYPRKPEGLQQLHQPGHPQQPDGLQNPHLSIVLEHPQQPGGLQNAHPSSVLGHPQQLDGLQHPPQPDRAQRPHQPDGLQLSPQPYIVQHTLQHPQRQDDSQPSHQWQHAYGSAVDPGVGVYNQRPWTADNPQEVYPEQSPPAYSEVEKSTFIPQRAPADRSADIQIARYTEQIGVNNCGFTPANFNNPSMQPITQQPTAACYPYWQAGPPIQQEPIEDNMGIAICATLCCCWCIGICAIQSAKHARDAIAIGDMARAHSAAQKAKKLSIISIAIGSILTVIIILSIIISLN